MFEIATPTKRSATRTTKESGGEEETNTDVDENQGDGIAVDENATENDESMDVNATNGSENKDDCIVDAVGEVDDDADQIQLDDGDKLDISNVDNEDSLNLTIGEDEAKIFQDQEVSST